MIDRLLRQWRRFLLCTILFGLFMTLAAISGMWQISPYPRGLSAGISIALTLLIVVVVPLVLATYFAPSCLPAMEIVLMALIAVAILRPILELLIGADGVGPWSYGLTLLIAYFGIYKLIYGDWLTDFWRRDVPTRTTNFTIDRPIEEVWAGLFPSPETAARYYWPQTQFVAPPAGTGADFLMISPRKDGYNDSSALLNIEAAKSRTHFRILSRPLISSSRQGDYSMREEVTLTEHANEGTEVTLTRSFMNVPFGTRLFWFLMEDIKDAASCMKARLEDKRDWSLLGAQLLKPSRNSA
ncbi:MAG: hypothetical protein WBN04_20260 [Paracoccaceae bacterium]